ncbi:unnamed protein product [Parnassius apollo]|uniref:(apollo) hypothetical protein n=1 Tax=Parnassius apollo TaxID=110799 RepID=A0A8S3YAV5_PARAO|nr:unnamed protein product [Parnassius apollo]
MSECDQDVDRQEFYLRLDEVYKIKHASSNPLLTPTQYASLIERVNLARNNFKKTSADYRLLKRYETVKTPSGEKLIFAKCSSPGKRQYFVNTDEIYDIVRLIHSKLNHARLRRMMDEIKKKYKNITGQIVTVYLSLCKTCKDKDSRRKLDITNDVSDVGSSSSLNVNEPTITFSTENNTNEENGSDLGNITVYPELYSRGQVDILGVITSSSIDEYKYMMVYRDFVNKYTHLKALKSTKIDETVEALLEIFLVFGAPNILQSKNDISITTKICHRMSDINSDIKIVAGEPNPCESDFNGKSNNDILIDLNNWVKRYKKCKWQQALKYIQYSLNTTFNKVLCKTASETVFGSNPSRGLASLMRKEEYDYLQTEDELIEVLEKKEWQHDMSEQLLQQESLIPAESFTKLEPEEDEVSLIL